MDALLNALQWPAMATTLIAAWLVASQRKGKRNWGFWCFLASNVLWVIWGWHDHALALVTLQVGLFALNVRGARKNATPEKSSGCSREDASFAQHNAYLSSSCTHAQGAARIWR